VVVVIVNFIIMNFIHFNIADFMYRNYLFDGNFIMYYYYSVNFVNLVNLVDFVTNSKHFKSPVQIFKENVRNFS